jgi:hypothetical protein
VSRKAGITHGRAVAGAPLRCSSARASIDQRDVPMAEPHQVRDRELRSPEVIVHHDVDSAQPEVAADERNRYGARRGADHVRCQACSRQNDAVGAQLEQLFQSALLSHRVSVAGRDQRPVPALGGGRIETVEDLGKKDVVQVRDHDADVVGAPLDQASRHCIGAVAELLSRRQHRSSARSAHRRLAADHPRHDRLRHTGPVGDVDDRRRMQRVAGRSRTFELRAPCARPAARLRRP